MRNMANLDAGLEAAGSAPPDGNYLEHLFRARSGPRDL